MDTQETIDLLRDIIDKKDIENAKLREKIRELNIVKKRLEAEKNERLEKKVGSDK